MKELQGLRSTDDRDTMEVLRSLACKNREPPHDCDIVIAVQHHLYRGEASHRLPLLYLVDLIIRTVGQPYTDHFRHCLPVMAGFVWERANGALRASLRQLALTWCDVLPPEALSRIVGKIETYGEALPVDEVESRLVKLGRNLVGLASERRSPCSRRVKRDGVCASLEFNASLLREADSSAVEMLLATSEQTRSKFLDMRFLRNRRARSDRLAAVVRSRQWYCDHDQWLLGGAAAPPQQQADEDGDGGTTRTFARRNWVVEWVDPADGRRPACAISGEPFDSWYDAATDHWFLCDAVRLSGNEAARHGVEEGSVVKASVVCV